MAQGEGGGRPPIFETEEELAEKFAAYKEWVKEKPIAKPELIKSGPLAGEVHNIYIPRPLSVAGFCVFAKMGRRTYYDWQKSGKFSLTIAMIDDECFVQQSSCAQVGLYNPGFTSKRLGLVDKQEVTTKEIKGYEVLE